MIIESTPLTIAEAIDYAKKDAESDSEIIGFMKKFNKLNAKDAKALMQDIDNMHLLKMKQEHLIKIADILPETAEELNKIFIDVSLDEDETTKILDAIKKYR